jgi:hypothetical protein
VHWFHFKTHICCHYRTWNVHIECLYRYNNNHAVSNDDVKIWWHFFVPSRNIWLLWNNMKCNYLKLGTLCVTTILLMNGSVLKGINQFRLQSQNLISCSNQDHFLLTCQQL